jgi:molybdopterin/thiamine biosynthesis adenylyltransferase
LALVKAMSMNVSYYDLFERNIGVFTQKDQERIREAKIMIIGVGGMGGTVAVLLARTGFTKFYLIDPETYELSNMNRQIGCFIDTIGKYKVEVIKNDILRINPEAQVIGDSRKLSLPEIEKTIKEWCPDVVIAEADDVAFSAKVIRIATRNGIYAITGMPSGFTGYVMAFPPYTKYTPEGIFGLPENLPYEELYRTVEAWENKCGRRWYLFHGKWRVSWFKEWREGKKPITQIAPAVWLVASLTATEIAKYIVGKWKLVLAPYVWYFAIADNEIYVRKYAENRLFNKYALKAFSIKTLGIGEKWRKAAIKIFEWQLKQQEKIEQEEDKNAEKMYQERKNKKPQCASN